MPPWELVFRGSGGSFTYIHKYVVSVALRRGLRGLAAGRGLCGHTCALTPPRSGPTVRRSCTCAATSPPGLLSTFALGIFLFVNLLGAKLSGGVELGVVAIKLAILGFFAVVGLWGIHASHFLPIFNKGLFTPLAAVALIFVAFEGFELIPNAVDEMEHPERNLRLALIIAIVVTTIIYNRGRARGARQPGACADRQGPGVRARRWLHAPCSGTTGFVMIGIAALLSTASAINATLFGASRLAMVMGRRARSAACVSATRARSRSVPWVALLTLSVVALVFTLTGVASP